MLTLGRRVNEKIVIRTAKGDVVVTFCGWTREGEPLLGFEAPRSIEIWRGEIYEQREAHE
jgi:carbon storage regulator CsrA